MLVIALLAFATLASETSHCDKQVKALEARVSSIELVPDDLKLARVIASYHRYQGKPGFPIDFVCPSLAAEAKELASDPKVSKLIADAGSSPEHVLISVWAMIFAWQPTLRGARTTDLTYYDRRNLAFARNNRDELNYLFYR